MASARRKPCGSVCPSWPWAQRVLASGHSNQASDTSPLLMFRLIAAAQRVLVCGHGEETFMHDLLAALDRELPPGSEARFCPCL